MRSLLLCLCELGLCCYVCVKSLLLCLWDVFAMFVRGLCYVCVKSLLLCLCEVFLAMSV